MTVNENMLFKFIEGSALSCFKNKLDQTDIFPSYTVSLNLIILITRFVFYSFMHYCCVIQVHRRKGEAIELSIELNNLTNFRRYM